jgi:indole-3-glycerol phosphate synthase
MLERLTTAIRKRSGALGVIAELKPRRHEGVDLFRGRTPSEIAGIYHAAGVDALSVVTSSWFGGSLQLLEEVVAVDTGLPILRKDLIRDKSDIQASRRAGASAVLLAMPLLGLRRIVELARAAWDEELEPLVEVATSDEIKMLRDAYGGIVAINNSDIRTCPGISITTYATCDRGATV